MPYIEVTESHPAIVANKFRGFSPNHVRGFPFGSARGRAGRGAFDGDSLRPGPTWYANNVHLSSDNNIYGSTYSLDKGSHISEPRSFHK